MSRSARPKQFLALTGARLDGAECLEVGLATHYLPAATLAQAKAEIAADPARADAILASYADAPPQARIAANLGQIDRLFAVQIHAPQHPPRPQEQQAMGQRQGEVIDHCKKALAPAS